MKEYVLPEIANRFIKQLKSENTKKGYTVELSSFFDYIIKNRRWTISVAEITLTHIERITVNDIDDYVSMKTIKRKSIPSDNTKQKRREVLLSFYDFLENRQLINKNIVKAIKPITIGKRIPKYLSEVESRELLESVDGEFKERNYAIISVLLNAALRISELVNLNLNHIQEDEIRFIGKGDKERIVPLNNACLEAINIYLSVRPKTKTNALFLSEDKKRLSVSRIQKIMKKYLTKIGHPEMSTHKIRHTSATLMYKNGVDLNTLKEILGHESISTTSIYTHVDRQQLRNAVNCNPLNVIAE